MNNDESAEWASREAKKLPEISPSDKAPFQYLRTEFHSAFRDARTKMTQSRTESTTMRAVLHLGARLFNFLDPATLGLGGEPAFSSRGTADNAATGLDQLLLPLGENLEARLWVAADNVSPGPSLHIDVVQDFERARPFTVHLRGETTQPVIKCEDPLETLLLPVAASGSFEIEITCRGNTSLLQLDIL